MNLKRQSVLSIATALLLVLGAAHPVPVLAKAGGITGESGIGSKFCTNCHGGGIVPTVVLRTVDGTNEVASGGTKEFELIINGGQQIGGGFNVAVGPDPVTGDPAGVFSVSPNDAGVQVSRNADEATHTSPRGVDANNQVTFRFNWTAPVYSQDTAIRMVGAGNSVNLDGSTNGDNAAMADINVTVLGGNPPPIAVIQPPSPIQVAEGATINFDGSQSTDNGTIVAYEWDFGDGSPIATGAQVDKSYPVGGTYTVTLTVTDDGDLQGTATATVEVFTAGTIPPTADAGGPYVGKFNELLTVDGGGSSDPDGTITSYFWEFGDGGTWSSTDSAIGYHTYTTAGDYTITLTVTDSDGLTDSATTTVRVLGLEDPLADPGGPYIAVQGIPIQFESRSAATCGIRQHTWQFGDGGQSTQENPVYTYFEVGTWGLFLQVWDNCGNNDTALQFINVSAEPPPPIANAGGPYTGVVGESLTFNGSGTTLQGETIVQYDWDFGDGTTLSGSNAAPTHTYATAGTFDISLVVTDSLGGISQPAVSSVAVTDTAQPSITRVRNDGTIRVRTPDPTVDTFRISIELLGLADGETRDATVYLSGDNGASYSQATVLTAGDRTEVDIDHSYTEADAGVVSWTIWVVTGTGQASQQVTKTVEVTVR